VRLIIYTASYFSSLLLFLPFISVILSGLKNWTFCRSRHFWSSRSPHKPRISNRARARGEIDRWSSLSGRAAASARWVICWLLLYLYTRNIIFVANRGAARSNDDSLIDDLPFDTFVAASIKVALAFAWHYGDYGSRRLVHAAPNNSQVEDKASGRSIARTTFPFTRPEAAATISIAHDRVSERERRPLTSRRSIKEGRQARGKRGRRKGGWGVEARGGVWGGGAGGPWENEGRGSCERSRENGAVLPACLRTAPDECSGRSVPCASNSQHEWRVTRMVSRSAPRRDMPRCHEFFPFLFPLAPRGRALLIDGFPLSLSNSKCP
jgi:hypothetical protein